MSSIGILLISVVVLLLAYRFYGRYIAGRLGISNDNPTPAHTMRDGVDYEPSRRIVVLGHHFASIAGAGPIVGPVIAVAFGWIPALLWILLGGIFFGAVHDLASMTASLRHKGKSIGEIIQRYIGDAGKRLFLIFSFSTLILVIAVFADIIAKTFVSVPSSGSASMFFIFLAVAFGFITKRFNLPFWLSTVIGVALMYFLVFAGSRLPLEIGYGVWMVILFAYIFLASVAPVWVLLQPRDFLNSFLLYGMILFGVLGIFVARPEIRMDTDVALHVEGLGYLFPVLFVTVACGAISGFHSLVASGTTSKQIDREEDARVIGYGGMLIESLLAVVALISVIVLLRDDYVSRLTEVGPVTLFSQGVGGFMAAIGIPYELGVSFVALTVSAFALTTLDTCTRLARYIVQEYFEGSPQSAARVLAKNRYVATTVPVFLSVLLLTTGEFGTLWPIFGSANQLLGALALLAVSVWLIKKNVNPVFTLVPMVFMFAVTLSSLFLFAWNYFNQHVYILAVVATFLFVLAIVLLRLAYRSLRVVDQQVTVQTS
jgi:carbon starvation protein